MRILAIETATEACSVALFEGGELVDARHEELGRGHAERLVPLIESLPCRGRADQVRVSLGPGSFTGVRIGLAVARALTLPWQARAVGYATLGIVARMAATRNGGCADIASFDGGILVCMNGGHGEWFVQPFSPDGRSLSGHQSMAPDAAVAAFAQTLVVGSRAEEFVALRGHGAAHRMLPDARYAMTLHEDELSDRLAPIYGRPPDARLPGA